MSAIDELSMKFTSGNAIPVERATVTLDEWLAVLDEHNNIRANTLHDFMSWRSEQAKSDWNGRTLEEMVEVYLSGKA